MASTLPRTVIFDLDGTLVDTSPDLTAALNAVLVAAGRRPLPEEEVRHLVGRGALVLIRRGMEVTGAPVDEALVPKLLQDFLDHYGANIAAGSQPFSGAENAVRRLIAEGHKVGICTNKPEALSFKLMDALNLRRYFPIILGADSQPYRKPDPRHLLDTVAKLGGDPKNAVMVGDSETDVKTAQAANIPVILVSFGYTEIPVRQLGGDVIIDHFDALDAAIAKLA
ncbi:MAG TPA: phosphoglycolate phosphatase [Candidatus Acidoferrales bacterium]|nr:phosphoglycolate phosphatase [Candidatus Acidoferrales bacterium]